MPHEHGLDATFQNRERQYCIRMTPEVPREGLIRFSVRRSCRG